MLTIAKTTPEPGVYYTVPFSEYARWDAFNPSSVKVLLADSAMAMRHTIDHGRESTDSMDLGRAEHCCLLEPEKFEYAYRVWTGGVRRGKEWDAFEDKALADDCEVLTQKELEACIAMRDSVLAHEASRELLAGRGSAEVSVVWNDPGTGLLCKGRIDWLGGHKLVDIKTASDPKPWAFITQATKLLYHVSIGAYVDGLKQHGIDIESAHFIAVGNKPWHDVVRYDIAPSALRRGRQLWIEGLQRVAWCMKHDQWPGFCSDPCAFELPEWAMGESALSIGDEPAFEGDGYGDQAEGQVA